MKLRDLAFVLAFVLAVLYGLAVLFGYFAESIARHAEGVREERAAFMEACTRSHEEWQCKVYCADVFYYGCGGE